MEKTNVGKRVAVLGVFAAVIVVLQLLSYSIKVGPFNLSFVLIPIVLGAVLYGPKTLLNFPQFPLRRQNR